VIHQQYHSFLQNHIQSFISQKVTTTVKDKEAEKKYSSDEAMSFFDLSTENKDQIDVSKVIVKLEL